MATKVKTLSVKEMNMRKKTIPSGLLRAFGLLKKKKVNALGYQKRKRSEWER
ncbi:MAG TPA: hypothetical protein VJI96_03750 [Candidatus Andersenbacteria bacterium]|nr:hypothetical protein [Candidatus Andersenbacteria bacterium]